MENFIPALMVSGIALSAIFLTLTLLILVIKALVAWMPYQAPPPTSQDATGSSPEHVAAIHSALAYYLGKPPDQIQLKNIKPL